MYAELITAILSFFLILIVFKIIYLEKNPLLLGWFWLIQFSAIFLELLFISNGKLIILIPFVVSFFIVLILFKIFNKQKNLFKMIWFWIVQIIVAGIISFMMMYVVLFGLGGVRSREENLFVDLNIETISSVVLIQDVDTVQIKEDQVQWFVLQLSNAKTAVGPVKYSNKGKIIFTRTDESKDSISTNGYGYGPYKGKWYQSEENVLNEFITK